MVSKPIRLGQSLCTKWLASAASAVPFSYGNLSVAVLKDEMLQTDISLTLTMSFQASLMT